MTDPATFVITDNRIDVMFGAQLIGVIEPEQNGTALYRVFLPFQGAPDRYRPAASPQMARFLVLAKIGEWLAESGLTFAPLAQEIAVQARREAQAAHAPPLFGGSR